MDAIKPEKQRIEQLDIIRGFALFGVLLVNLTMIDETLFSYQSSPFVYEHLPERLSSLVLHVFATGKFYTIFAILFGMGAIFFMNRFESEREGAKRFRKRLLVLLLIGIGHLVFVWYGDILHVYAIAGFLMLPKRHLSARRLIGWSIFAFAMSTILFTLLAGPQKPTPEMIEITRQSIEAYTQSGYLDMVRYRVVWELPMILINMIIVLPKILSLFFFGAALAKLDVFGRTVEANRRIELLFKGSLLISTILACSYMITSSGVLGVAVQRLATIFEELLTVSGALFYSSTIILILRHPSSIKRMRLFAYVGRMSLSNYLMQTIFFTTLLYGYGGGMFHKIPYWSYLPIALIFFILQSIISSLWLKKFKVGPVEYLTRAIIYR